MSTLQLDHALLERYALQLERKARSVRLGSTIVGGLLGALLGTVPVSPVGEFLPVPASFVVATILAGGAVGALFGHVIGDGRALAIKVQSQLVLFQLQAQRPAEEPQSPLFEPTELLPVRRPVLEAVPTPAEQPRLESVPPPTPLLPPVSPSLGT